MSQVVIPENGPENMPQNDLLRVEGLKVYFDTRRFGTVKAVDGVSFSLAEGESLGIVGESGSGKTVTALSILRLEPKPAKIVGGHIWFKGEDLAQKRQRDMRKLRGAELSMILQDPMTSLNPSFPIGSQIGESITLHKGLKRGRLHSKVIQALDLVRIPSATTRLNDFPHQLSGGMRQRVVGAIALSSEPGLLIADEPTTSLDVTIQSQYLQLMTELQQQTQVGLIFITHDLGIVAKVCDKVAVMYAGRVVEQGPVVDLFEHPAHPYTSGLLNCLPRLEQVDKLAQIEGQPPDPAQFPVGCRFAPRCPKAQDICRQEYPDETQIGDAHTASCWFPEL